MKFALASDIHLHFGPCVLENTENATVLVLAGDVYEAAELPAIEDEFHYVRTFFRDIASKFKHVLWVAGNHEHYDTMYPSAHEKIRRWLLNDPLLDNIKFLEQETVEIEGVLFHGTTLWTDLNNLNPITVQQVVGSLNDYQYIRGWNAHVQYKTFHESLDWLTKSLQKDKPNVVITHHHPCSLSIEHYYLNDPTNFGYYTELSEFIFDHQEIKFWCCGHIHTKKYYSIDDTYVVCNPRGYADEHRKGHVYNLEFYEVTV